MWRAFCLFTCLLPGLLYGDYDRLVAEAVQARNGGDFATAEAKLRTAYHLASDQRESAYLLSMVLAFQEKYAEAEHVVDTALLIYPEDQDLLDARVKIRAWRAPAESWSHEIIANYETSGFNKVFLPNWQDSFVEYRHKATSGNQQYLRVEDSRRFDLHDAMFEAGASFRQFSLPLEVGIGIGEDVEFLPRLRARLGTELSFRDGGGKIGQTIARVTWRGARYLTGTTQSINLEVDYYLASGTAFLSPGVGVVRDEDGGNTLAWRVGAHRNVGDWRFGLTWTDAPETEANVTSATRVLHGYVHYRLADALWLRVDLARSIREASYIRESVGLTLGYRFR